MYVLLRIVIIAYLLDPFIMRLFCTIIILSCTQMRRHLFDSFASKTYMSSPWYQRIVSNTWQSGRYDFFNVKVTICRNRWCHQIRMEDDSLARSWAHPSGFIMWPAVRVRVLESHGSSRSLWITMFISCQRSTHCYITGGDSSLTS